MMKLTMLFGQGGSPHLSGRVAGWSETWWNNWTTAAWITAGSRLIQTRLQMLTDRAYVQGYRVKDTTGVVQIDRTFLAGAIATNADIPQMALSCSTQTSDRQHTKYFRLRGLPDARVLEGKFVPSDAFNTAFTNFRTCLQAEGWGWLGVNPANPLVKINSIDANGNITCAAGGTFAVGNTVVIRRCKNDAGKTVNGRFRILARTSDQAFQIANWVGGTVTAKGTVALYTTQLYVADRELTVYSMVTTQKVGRPFDLYRGRVTRR